MKILVVGSGGREHAIVQSLANSPRVSGILVAPGNAGTASAARNVPVPVVDVHALSDLAERESVDLTIVGPEQPLVAGVVDHFIVRGLRIVGPTAAAARLEGSKAFAKSFMVRYRIPTADFRTFGLTDVEAANEFIDEVGAPVVVKASGLAAGKGAVVCDSVAAARKAVRKMLIDRTFGSAGEEVVVEEFMAGNEASVFAVCDGSDFVLLSTAQDHKRVGEGDTGPNTGGMGAYAPAVIMDDDTLERVVETIVRPTLAGMVLEGCPYTGFLYVGLMLTDDGPRVVEYNCRLGDPEAQVVLPLLRTDLAEVLECCADRRLGGLKVEHYDGAAACVVLCSGGYPGSYREGIVIGGLDRAGNREGVSVFHAGTSADGDRIVTAGGRVVGVTAVGVDLERALDLAYGAVADVSFEGMHYRRDIGRRGLAHLTHG